MIPSPEISVHTTSLCEEISGKINPNKSFFSQNTLILERTKYKQVFDSEVFFLVALLNVDVNLI